MCLYYLHVYDQVTQWFHSVDKMNLSGSEEKFVQGFRNQESGTHLLPKWICWQCDVKMDCTYPFSIIWQQHRYESIVNVRDCGHTPSIQAAVAIKQSRVSVLTSVSEQFSNHQFSFSVDVGREWALLSVLDSPRNDAEQKQNTQKLQQRH